MTDTFTWLHSSDLHLTCKKDSEDWTAKSINQASGFLVSGFRCESCS